MQKIIPFLWFDDQAEEAVDFYTAVFKKGKKGYVDHFDKASAEVSGKPEGSVLGVEFEIEGYMLGTINGGPVFKPNPSISFFVNCQSEAEVNQLWGKLVENGNPLMPLASYPFSKRYGWVEDRYGVSWQLLLTDQVGQKIIPSLMFVGEKAGRAEEAIHYYVSIFDDSKVGNVSHYGPGQEPDLESYINFAEFTLLGQKFAIMDSAQDHRFDFSEGNSLLVDCKTQEEVDYYWDRLSAVPEAEQCGWLKDKFGVSWQIVPEQLNKLLRSPDPIKASRVMEAMLPMKKLVIAELEAAYHS